MPVDEKTIYRIVEEVLAEMEQKHCNVPIITKKDELLFIDGENSVVPIWSVVFTCDNPDDKNKRTKAKFDIEILTEKNQDQIKQEIYNILQNQLGKK